MTKRKSHCQVDLPEAGPSMDVTSFKFGSRPQGVVNRSLLPSCNPVDTVLQTTHPPDYIVISTGLVPRPAPRNEVLNSKLNLKPGSEPSPPPSEDAEPGFSAADVFGLAWQCEVASALLRWRVSPLRDYRSSPPSSYAAPPTLSPDPPLPRSCRRCCRRCGRSVWAA